VTKNKKQKLFGIILNSI